MNLKHAQYIMEIIKEGSITNASKTMHVSQPALSQTIKAVEKYLGAPNFFAEYQSHRPDGGGEKIYCSGETGHHHQLQLAPRGGGYPV